MQPTIFLAIVLLGLSAYPNWAQDPVASPAVSPPVPPVAETVAPPAVSTSIFASSEAAKLIIYLEQEKALTMEDYGSDHPKVKELDARLAQARSQITLNPEPPEADSQETLQKEMEQAIRYLEMATGTDSPRHNEAKAKMAEILARYDQTPAQAKIEGLKLISQVEAEALPRLEAQLETVKSHRTVQSTENLKGYESLLTYWTVTVAQLKGRINARTQTTGRIQPRPASETTATTDPIASEAAKLIVQLEDERVKLLQDLGPKHPKVELLDARLALARKSVTNGQPDSSGNLDFAAMLKQYEAAVEETQLLEEKLARMHEDSNLDLQPDADSERLLEETRLALKQAEAKLVVVERQILSPDKQSQAALLRAIVTSLSQWQRTPGTDKSRAVAIEAEISAILARADELPEAVQKATPELVEQLDNEAIACTEKSIDQERLDMAKRESSLRPDQVTDFTEIRRLESRLAALKRVQSAHSFLRESPAVFTHSSAQAGNPLSPPVKAAIPADLPQQIAQLRKDYDAADAEAHQLAERLRQPGSTGSKEELRKTVERAFKLRQSLLRAELSEMLDRLAKTQHSIDQRGRITDQIVTRRVEELLNPQLEWDESKSGTQSVSPTTPPKESAQIQPAEWTARLQGHWQLTQYEFAKVDTSDGKKPQPGDIKHENWNPETYYRKTSTPMKAMFDGNQMNVCKEDGSEPMTLEFTFRKAGPPQQVDLTPVYSEEQIGELKLMAEETQSPTVIPKFLCIIEETPDGFRMCLDMKGTGTRPFLFVLGPDTGLWEFRREAAAQPKQPQEQAADLEVLPDLSPQPSESKTADSEPDKANPSHITPQQLTSLYQEILRRDPTKKEEDTWINFARSRSAIPILITTLVTQESVFNRVRRDQKRYVVLLHELLLDRKPTAEELRYWTLRFDKLNGKRHDIVGEFLESVGDSFAENLLNRLALVNEMPLSPAARTDLIPSAQIPKGMRLNTFPVTDSQTHSGMLRPGDRVDVKVTFTTRNGAIEAKTLLEYVLVFASEDKDIDGDVGQPVHRSRYVTLLVTPEQDGYIEIAKAKGQLSLSLRNPEDDERVNANGLNADTFEELRTAIKSVEPPPAATTKLDGDWHLLAIEEGGRRRRSPGNLSIHGNVWTFSWKGGQCVAEMAVDSQASIRWLSLSGDITSPDAPKIPKDNHAIYELQGDLLTVLYPVEQRTYVWEKGSIDLQTSQPLP